MDFQSWKDKVTSTGGCLHPVRLTGAWSVTDTTTGTVLADRSGHILAPCNNRRASVCPACSDRYAADAFHLVAAGLSGGKGVPETVTTKPRIFATLTAPSFGAVHGRRVSGNGKTMPCGCGGFHHPDDPRLGTPIDPESYDYTGSVLWQANLGQLWQRFITVLRRYLARAAGLTVREFGDHARLSYGKVAEYQRRGLIHFHAVIRVDGPDGPTSPTPKWVTAELLNEAIATAARSACLSSGRPNGQPLELRFGSQVDLKVIRPAALDAFEDPAGEISESRLAAYVAKYATKGTGKTEGPDRRIRSELDIEHLVVSEHHRRIIRTCWELGGMPEYASLNLRKWAHMLGFRGHFLSKSRKYSTTFKDLRETRSAWRRAEALERLGVTEDQVLVVNHWDFTGIGYADDAERELAAAIGERVREQRKRKYETERRDSERAARKENDHA
ncbi:replication initiator [Allokutzneria oryzae]|uniref:replication initiator n=1 Tax=Allokutzneria oryzae TaxID=1378989 RepID=UPI00366D7F01